MQPAIENTNGEIASEPRALVGVCSCRRYASKRAAVRETWAHLVPKNVRVVFFVGEGAEPCEPDVWQLPCPDTYEALPCKVQLFMRRALLEPDWGYLFKCDDDTYVVLERLLDLIGSDEFLGSTESFPLGFASGGAGYLVSRRCVELVADAAAPAPGAEDVWVSRALQAAGISLASTSRLQPYHQSLPSLANNLATAHWCSPELMRTIHAEWLGAQPSAVRHHFHARHAAWAGPVRLLQSGLFLGGGSAPDGRWEITEDGAVLALKWFHWPEDLLRRIGGGFGNATLHLERVPANGEAHHKPPDAEKLHLGAGSNRLPGWMNHDLDMDLRQPLPLPDESIRFLFAEHVVEHITPGEAWKFFQEARRLLKPGGAMRIAVPCVDLIGARYDDAYAEFLRRAIGGDGSKQSAMESIICNWGHQAVWSVGTLRAVLEALGFQTEEAQPGRSRFAELNGIEGHARAIGEHANRVETGVVEAVKARAGTGQNAAYIPRKIHFVWFGSELPAFYHGLIEHCRRLHPGWLIRIWGEEEVRGLILGMKTGLETQFDLQALSLATRSDLARYHIIAQEGGIYLDADFFLWRSLDALLDKPCFLVEQQDGIIATSVFGAIPGHALLQRVLEHLQKADFSQSPLKSAGPLMFDFVSRAWLSHSAHAELLGPHSFFPVPYDTKEYLSEWESCAVQGAFGAHLWAHSWGEQGGDSRDALYARVGVLMLKTSERKGDACPR